MTRRRRARGAPDQRARRRLVPRAAQARARAARREARAGARDRARDACASPPASTSPTTSRTTSSSRSTSRASTRSTAAGSSRTAASTSPSPSTTSTSSRSTSPWSNALHSQLRRARLLPLRPARALRARRRPALAARARGRDARPGSSAGERNPFRSIVVRCGRARLRRRRGAAADRRVRGARRARRRASSRAPASATAAPRRRAASSTTATSSTTTGTILDAKIVPPTSQNQRTIEEDLRGVVERSLDVPDEELALLCEQTIRNYDPCISCATHFLTLEVERLLRVIGVGNAWRGDDAVGLAVARAARGHAARRRRACSSARASRPR